MRKIFLLPISIIAFIAVAVSCDNDFSVSDDWEDVTVIYSLLDPGADTNWVRVERGYLGSASASQSYGVSDSLYYDSLVVYLLAYNQNGAKVDSIYLERDNTSRDRQPGVFTTNDYRLYRTTEDINDDSTYTLVVKQTDAKFTDARATTEIIGGPGGSIASFGFINPRDVRNAPRQFNGRVEINSSKRAKIYEVYFTFNYEEYDIPTKNVVNKSINFRYGTVRGDGTNASSITFTKSLSQFYEQIAGLVPVDESKLRFFTNMDIKVYAGGSDLEKYMALNEPTSSVNQTKPEFPGIENGTGLFSSRTSILLKDVKFTTEINNKFYLSTVLCDRNFASATAGDTFVCKMVSGLGPQKEQWN